MTDITIPIIVSIAGLGKSGKSHFMLTFPEPLVVFSLDIGLEPVLKKFPGKDVDIKTYPLPIFKTAKGNDAQKEVAEIWDKISGDLEKVIEDTSVKTIAFDTYTAIYELARITRAHQIGQKDLLQHQYGDVYAMLKGQIQHVRLAGQNLVLTHYLKEGYKGGEPTGELVLDGWKGVITEADIAINIEQVVEKKGKDKNVFMKSTIKACRFDRDLTETELVDASYGDLMDLIV